MNGDSKPFLTVAIPVFNGESCLAPMLESLERQDEALFEVRFGDDGSTDGSMDILADYSARHPGHVFVERHQNIGPGPSRNRLLSQAKGDYIWFCDADDEIVPGCVARIVSVLQSTPVDFLAFLYGRGPFPADCAQTGMQNEPVPVSISQLLLSTLGATVAKIVRTDRLKRTVEAFPACRAGEDFVYTVRAACACETGSFWFAKPYWARNGFWKRTDTAHATCDIDENYCTGVLDALDILAKLRDDNPELRMEIGVQSFVLADHVRNRIRDEAPPDIRRKWLPQVSNVVRSLVAAGDNPLLRIPNSFAKNERAALRREQTVRQSLSWRLTAPLRTIAGLISGCRRRT